VFDVYALCITESAAEVCSLVSLSFPFLASQRFRSVEIPHFSNSTADPLVLFS